jgi:hypothetical protein
MGELLDHTLASSAAQKHKMNRESFIELCKSVTSLVV